MTRREGFTVTELITLIIFIGIAATLVYLQFLDFQKISDDKQRKTAINAIHYSLEEAYYKNNGSYPKTVDASILPSVDPALFKDPEGRQINTTGSSYHYEAIGCRDNTCDSYYLYAELEKEARYEKRST